MPVFEGHRPTQPFPRPQAITDIDQFIIGFNRTVSFTRETRVKTYVNLERLVDIDEIWTLCFRRPKPGWRIFGRFKSYNHFIGLRAYDRHQLVGHLMTKAAQQTIADWNQIVGVEPFRGQSPIEYMSGVTDVSEL
jgi:hypothetical protein